MIAIAKFAGVGDLPDHCRHRPPFCQNNRARGEAGEQQEKRKCFAFRPKTLGYVLRQHHSLNSPARHYAVLDGEQKRHQQEEG